MADTFITYAAVAGVSIAGLIYMVFRMQREHAKHVSELEFFLEQRTISHNQVRAKLSVSKSNLEKLKNEIITVQNDFEVLRIKEKDFDRAIKRNQFLEHKNNEFEKLEIEITNIQEILNGNIKKQLSNYMKEVDGLGKRLHRATYEFSENTKSFEFIDNQEAS